MGQSAFLGGDPKLGHLVWTARVEKDNVGGTYMACVYVWENIAGDMSGMDNRVHEEGTEDTLGDIKITAVGVYAST